MLQDLTAKQLNEWEAFNRIQPIGQRRMDVYFASLMASLHNIAIGFSGSKTAKQFKTEDFIPNWTGIAEDPVEMSTEEMKQFWIDFAEGHNKQVQMEKESESKPPIIQEQ